MPWTAGTVTVDDDGNVTGSGQALALYNAIASEEQAESPLPDPASPPDDWEGTKEAWRKLVEPIAVKLQRAWARQARAFASIATYAATNAVVSVQVKTTDSGLQRLPASIVTGQPTDAPSTTKTITGTIG
jgi:hypothetical protein